MDNKTTIIYYHMSIRKLYMEPPVRFELTTWGLQNPCSTHWAKVALLNCLLLFDYILKRNNKLSGGIFKDNNIILAMLKDISYSNKNVYSLIRGITWDERIELPLKNIAQYCFTKDKNILFKTSSTDIELNNCLKKFGLIETKNELLLVRNTLIKRELKSSNKLNKSIESIIEKINPQVNPYPSPYPHGR